MCDCLCLLEYSVQIPLYIPQINAFNRCKYLPLKYAQQTRFFNCSSTKQGLCLLNWICSSIVGGFELQIWETNWTHHSTVFMKSWFLIQKHMHRSVLSVYGYTRALDLDEPFGKPIQKSFPPDLSPRSPSFVFGIINYCQWTGKKQSHLLCWPKKFVTILHWFCLLAGARLGCVAYQSRTEFGAIINLAKQQRQQQQPAPEVYMYFV